MILALDTDVLVAWVMDGAPFHQVARRLVRSEVKRRRGRLGIVPQVLYEFLHVATDAKRFERPLTMEQGIKHARALWEGREVERILPGPPVPARALELLSTLSLGRKRILDTTLAATLETAGVERFATFNGKDFAIFSFLKVVRPS